MARTQTIQTIADVRVEGIPEVTRLLRTLGDDADAAVTAELETAGLTIYERSQPRVPVATGALKRSGQVTSERSGQRITVTVSYGGPSTPRDVHYARIVHETHRSMSKFLEVPALEVIGVLEDRLTANLRARIAGR